MSVYPWQKEQWQKWLATLQGERVPHAILLYGNPGIGIRDFAQRAAQSLLCQAPSIEEKPCGACRGCQLLKAGNNRDYLTVEAEKETIKVDQVLNMIEFTQLARHSAEYRVVSIHNAEHLNYAASNALLKVLEEPPVGSVIIMDSENMPRLLATIRSRCHKVRFPLPGQEAVAWLADKLQCDPQQAEIKLQHYHSQVITALNTNEDNHENFHRDFMNFLNQGISLHDFVEQWHDKVSAKELQEWLLKEMHSTLRLKQQLPALNGGGQQAPVDRISAKNLERLCQLQMERCHVVNLNPNPRLLMEASLLEWARAFYGRQVS